MFIKKTAVAIFETMQSKYREEICLYITYVGFDAKLLLLRSFLLLYEEIIGKKLIKQSLKIIRKAVATVKN